jgi:hypothetical protein
MTGVAKSHGMSAHPLGHLNVWVTSMRSEGRGAGGATKSLGKACP